MASLASIRTEYKYAIQDLGDILEQINAVPGTDVRDKAISQAILWYTRRVPRVQTSLVVQNTTGFYAVPADYIDSSRVVYVEFPLDQTPPSYLGRKNFQIQRRETGKFLYLNPNPSGSYRLTYTAKHGGGVDGIDSVDANHESIIGRMAASIACEEFVARYSNSVSNNLDAVNYRTKAQEFTSAAKTLREQVVRQLRQSEWAQVYSTDVDSLVNSWQV